MDSPSEDEGLKTEQDQQQPEDSSTSDMSDTDSTENSSSSETSEEDLSTFDVVMNAIDGDKKSDDETESSSEEDDSDKSDDETEEKSEDETKDKDDKSDEPSDEELKAWKPKTRKRFEDLQAKYRNVNERLEKAEVEAGQYRQFTEFLEGNRITQDEANNLFNIGALMKNDPVKALEVMTPYYNNLLQVTGNVLPADLQTQVSQGYITKQHALELSRLRASGQTNMAIQQERQQHTRQQEIARQQQNTASMQTAIADWEKQWSTSDPDYSVKKDRVLERVELMLARANRDGKLPQTVDQAVELANKAKADVEAEYRQYRPKKAVRTVDGGSSSSSLPEPKDTKDVIRRALNQ